MRVLPNMPSAREIVAAGAPQVARQWSHIEHFANARDALSAALWVWGKMLQWQ